MKRFRVVLAVLALLALAIVVARPVVLSALDAPYGAHNSPDVELTRADGSPHCSLLADCETVSIANAGISLAQTGIVLVLGGLVLRTLLPALPRPRSWIAPVSSPPPLSALG
jgi:hypothetical protein